MNAPLALSIFATEAAWQYLAALAVLLIGLSATFRSLRSLQCLDKVLAVGPLFLAMPMAVFGMFHFLRPAVVAEMVPQWIPGHMFWVYFVGTALFAAAVSLATGRCATLASALLGLMLLSFVLLISVPAVAEDPKDRFAWTLTFRDTFFSSGALALALSRARKISQAKEFLTITLRSAMAMIMGFFAIEHFLHPEFVPVIPLRQPLPGWMPLHSAINYVVGSLLMAGAMCMLANRRARSAATWVGVVAIAAVLLVYLPLLLATPLDVSQVNYFFDTLTFAGSVLLLAALLAREEARTVVASVACA